MGGRVVFFNARLKIAANGNSQAREDDHVRSSSPFLRKIAAHQITASDLNTFTITFPFNTRMKFVVSGDELISMKETFGLCEGRADQLCHIPVRAA